MTDTQVAGIGHNRSPEPIDPVVERRTQLEDRAKKLLAALKRLPAVADEKVAAKVTDYIAQLTAFSSTLEKARTEEKEPHLRAGQEVDTWFRALTTPIGDAKRTANAALTTFLRKKADEERVAREFEAKRLRDEADRAHQAAAEAAASAEKPLAEIASATKVAAAVERQAVAVERSTQATLSDLSRTHTAKGSVASLRTSYAGRMTDRATLDLEALRPHLRLDAIQVAINAYVAAGGRELKGAVIEEVAKASVR